MIKQQIKDIDQQIAALKKQRDVLIGSCKHEIALPVKLTEWIDKNPNLSIQEVPTKLWNIIESHAAQCKHCDTYFSEWFCLYSPDHRCHYFPADEDEGSVMLANGELYPIPVELLADIDDYTDDCCIFCNLPEERK